MTARGRVLALLTVTIVAVGACASPPGSSPAPVGTATAQVTRLVIQALSAVGLQGTESVRQFRPAEGPVLAGAPRSVVQATLPDDPGHGFIVVYALASPAAAEAAAADQARYVTSGVGRVQFTSDARFVLRVVGSNVVFFWWSPGAALDPRTADIETALMTIGVEVPVFG